MQDYVEANYYRTDWGLSQSQWYVEGNKRKGMRDHKFIDKLENFDYIQQAVQSRKYHWADQLHRKLQLSAYMQRICSIFAILR